VIPLILVVYGTVTAWFAARFLWRWSRLDKMRRQSFAVTLIGGPARCWAQCSEHFAVRNASLAASYQVFAPVTMGFSQKLLLLPAGITSRISEAEMQSVFAHEFAHMRRNDFLKNLFYELVSLPVSYHPVVWHVRAKITESREMICDQIAAAIAGRGQYPRSLLRLASLLIESAPARTAHALGIFDSNTLERRLMKLADHPSEIRGLRRFAAVAACLALGAATCASALALRMQVNSTEASGNHPTAHPAKVNVSPEIMQNQIIYKVVPKYPVDAKKARIQGKVVLNAVIGKDGSVTDLKVDSGPKELRQSSLDAVKQWKYKPYLLNGQPVAVKTTINITYTLAEEKK
jgi:TonB family protein